MDIFVPVFALFFIGVGFLIKKYPTIMSPYNSMPKEKLKNVDLLAISNLFFKGFIVIAISMAVLYFSPRLLGIRPVYEIVWLAPCFIITPALLVKAQKYDRNPRGTFAKYWIVWLVTIIFASILMLLLIGILPTKAVVGGGSIRFTGVYGITVPLDSIAKFELTEQIPHITAKTNGFAMADIRKGMFRLRELGKCRLFINKTGNPPYLYIELTTGEKIIFNSADQGYTEDIYDKLLSLHP